MRKLSVALLVAVCLPALASAATWENVPLVDAHCAQKVKGNPDKHPTSCLLKCADGGYGVMMGENWVKLDDAGNKLAVSELKKTKKADHVRVNVTGEQAGDVIQVSALQIAK